MSELCLQRKNWKNSINKNKYCPICGDELLRIHIPDTDRFRSYCANCPEYFIDNEDGKLIIEKNSVIENGHVIEKSCATCRHNPEERHYFAQIGADCNLCKDFCYWILPKRFDPNLCAKCLFDEDPCAYDCVKCMDGKNFEIQPTYAQECQSKIDQLKNQILFLENEILKSKTGEI